MLLTVENLNHMLEKNRVVECLFVYCMSITIIKIVTKYYFDFCYYYFYLFETII